MNGMHSDVEVETEGMRTLEHLSIEKSLVSPLSRLETPLSVLLKKGIHSESLASRRAAMKVRHFYCARHSVTQWQAVGNFAAHPNAVVYLSKLEMQER